MDEHRHKARKNYTCDHCHKPILVGEIYSLGKDRIPVYSPDKMDLIHGYSGNQTGIKYMSWKICCRCLKEFEK